MHPIATRVIKALLWRQISYAHPSKAVVVVAVAWAQTKVITVAATTLSQALPTSNSM